MIREVKKTTKHVHLDADVVALLDRLDAAVIGGINRRGYVNSILRSYLPAGLAKAERDRKEVPNAD